MTNSTAPPRTEPAFIEVGTRRCGAQDRGARPSRRRARACFGSAGFNSDMQGTKALALDAWAAEQGRACVRFDYSGHGESGGAFVDGTIGALAGGERRGVRPVLRRAAGRDRLIDGRLDGAAAGARDWRGATSRQRARRWPGWC